MRGPELSVLFWDFNFKKKKKKVHKLREDRSHCPSLKPPSLSEVHPCDRATFRPHPHPPSAPCSTPPAHHPHTGQAHPYHRVSARAKCSGQMPFVRKWAQPTSFTFPLKHPPPHYRAPHHCLCPLPCFMPFWLSPPSDTLKCNLLEDRAPIPLSYGLPGTQKTTSRIPGVQRAAERAYG